MKRIRASAEFKPEWGEVLTPEMLGRRIPE